MRKLKRSAGGGSRSWRLITLLAGSVVLCLHLLLPALRAASLWGAEAAAGRVAAPVAWELPPGPAQLDGADLPVLFLAVASKGLQEFILNWVQGVRSIQVRQPGGRAAAWEPRLSHLCSPGAQMPALACCFRRPNACHSAHSSPSLTRRDTTPLLQVPYVLASLDNDTLGMLRDLGLPYLHVPGLVLDTEE